MRSLIPAALVTFIVAPVFAGGLFGDDECRHTSARNATTPAAGVARILIHGEAGSLAVTGREGVSQIAVTGMACSSDDDLLEAMTLVLRKSGSDLHIDSRVPSRVSVLGFFEARLDFAVVVPAGIPVVIDDGSGLIEVRDTGATTIDDASGSIILRGIRGDVRIDDDSGSIEIDGVAGQVSIDDDSGEIVVKNVRGDVEIEDDSGSILVAGAERMVRIRNDDSGSIDIREVRGNVTIDSDSSGSVEVVDVGGSFSIGRKSSGHVEYARVSGKVTIPRED